MRRILVLLAAALSACGSGSKEEAQAAVRTYVARLAEAYRTADASLVDPLVGDTQGMKLLGLIGVKHDAGVTLDAKLLELQFVRVEREGTGWIVETRERWYYRDLKLGTGAQVGEDSTDSYALRYRFERVKGKLVLEDLAFTAPPEVGRKTFPLPTDPRLMHGLPPKADDSDANGGAGPPRAVPPSPHGG